MAQLERRRRLSFGSGDHILFFVAISGMTANGTVIGDVAAGVAIDEFSNPNQPSTSSDNTVTQPAFVLLEYFGYLRRNPNDAPDSNFAGYNFWLAKMDSFSLPDENAGRTGGVESGPSGGDGAGIHYFWRVPTALRPTMILRRSSGCFPGLSTFSRRAAEVYAIGFPEHCGFAGNCR